MPYSDEASIERIALGVIERTLPKREWTHEAHFAAALWLCRHRPDLTRPDAIRALISRYNEATDTPNTDSGGYHHTITLASLRGAADVLDRAEPDAPLHLVLDMLMASDLGHKDWILSYWTGQTLFGVAARRGWIAPDLKPLPF